MIAIIMKMWCNKQQVIDVVNEKRFYRIIGYSAGSAADFPFTNSELLARSSISARLIE